MTDRVAIEVYLGPKKKAPPLRGFISYNISYNVVYRGC
jgi:hypothetical protein